MGRQAVALPEAEISAGWNSTSGRVLQHPYGLCDGIRPDWDQVRARREALAGSAGVEIVQVTRGRSTFGLRRAVRRFLGLGK